MKAKNSLENSDGRKKSQKKQALKHLYTDITHFLKSEPISIQFLDLMKKAITTTNFYAEIEKTDSNWRMEIYYPAKDQTLLLEFDDLGALIEKLKRLGLNQTDIEQINLEDMGKFLPKIEFQNVIQIFPVLPTEIKTLPGLRFEIRNVNIFIKIQKVNEFFVITGMDLAHSQIIPTKKFTRTKPVKKLLYHYGISLSDIDKLNLDNYVITHDN